MRHVDIFQCEWYVALRVNITNAREAMREIITTVTERGQVTIPAEVRRRLGIKPHDKVAFAIDETEVRLLPARFTLETAFGSVKPLSKPEDFRELSRLAKEEHAAKVVGEMESS
jgi:AbrB family looped-hinge helix DNA binding protein